MAGYNSLKVTELKAELKRRGIPQTGLRVKQQFIDRLLKDDAATQGTGNQEEPAVAKEVSQDQSQLNEPSAQAEAAKGYEQEKEQGQEAEPTSHPAPLDGATVQEQSEAPSQAPTEDVAMKDVAKPVEAEETRTTQEVPSKQDEPAGQALQQPIDSEKPVDETPIPSTAPAPPSEEAETAPTPVGVTSKEEVDDSKKRKRRSQSPPPSPRTAALKKARADDGQPRVILEEDAGARETAAEPEGAQATAPVQKDQEREQRMDVDTAPSEIPKESEELKRPAESEPSSADQEMRDEPKKEQPAAGGPIKAEISEAGSKRVGAEEDAAHPPTHTKHAHGDARFKGLFPAANGGRARSPSPHREPARGADEDRIISPALHPATTSLYIRDFMRPLQPAVLRNHLVSLATPPSSSPDPDTVLHFFLDSIKTHCLVMFANISAASRVRSALHGTIWPDERTRKPLWADFIPEEKVKEWIAIEQDSGNGGRGAPRWEVTYDETDDGVTAILREASQVPALGARTSSMNLGREPPLGPRATHGDGLRRGSQQQHQPQPPPPGPAPTRYGGESFKALDDRFRSTDAKPKLYYLPVSRAISDKRLDRFDELARLGPTRKPGGDEMRKYTFEDDDFFVDRGPEYGMRGRRRGRGGGGGGGGGRLGDRSYGRGGSWRGRY